MTRNANRIDAIFKSFIRNMDRVVLLEYQFSLALVLVMRYVTRKKKLEKMRTRRKYWMRPMLQERKIATSIILSSQSCETSRATLSPAILKVRNFGKNWVVTSYIASQISPDDVHVNYFDRRLACEVELGSTSQANRRSMPGTDYVSGINVHMWLWLEWILQNMVRHLNLCI